MIPHKDYYTPPSQEIFDDIKQGATQIWKSYDDTYGYATEKVTKIKDLQNVSDNYAYMVAMFDQTNQVKLLLKVQRDDTRELISRLISP